MTPLESLRARSRVLMWLVTIPFVLLVLLALAQIATLFKPNRFTAVMLVSFTPMYIYIWAIWMIRQALKSIASGELFDRVVPRLLFRVGLALFVGGLFAVFGVPLVSMLLLRQHGFLVFDGAAVTLGIVGATLALLAQLLTHAAAMREELDEIL